MATTFPRWVNDTRPAFIYELSKTLSKNSDIFVLAPHCQGARLYEIIGRLKVYRYIYFIPFGYQRLAYGVSILNNIHKSNLAKAQIPFFFISELMYSIFIIKSKKIDIINSHWIIPQGFIGAICNFLFGIPHISTIHAADLFGLEKLPFKRSLCDFIVENSDGIIVVSSYIRERLLNLISPELIGEVEKKTRIIPMGVQTRLFYPRPNKDELKAAYCINSKYVVLFIGRFAEKKGIPYLIEAMPGIIRSMQNVSLILCGDGDLRKTYEKIVDALGMSEHIKFAGFVSDSEKIDYIGLADIIVIPSIIDKSGDTEGLPVVILESLAAGKPIIASDVSGIKDVIIDGFNGHLVSPQNSKQIEEKILMLLNNNTHREFISENALKTSENYDWSKIGDRMLTFMEDSSS